MTRVTINYYNPRILTRVTIYLKTNVSLYPNPGHIMILNLDPGHNYVLSAVATAAVAVGTN